MTKIFLALLLVRALLRHAMEYASSGAPARMDVRRHFYFGNHRRYRPIADPSSFTTLDIRITT